MYGKESLHMKVNNKQISGKSDLKIIGILMKV